jgi:hypothetical protein
LVAGKLDPSPWKISILPSYLGDYERNWTSRLAHVLVDFYLAHWKWFVGSALAILGLVTAWVGDQGIWRGATGQECEESDPAK